jgi:hypothetical protein
MTLTAKDVAEIMRLLEQSSFNSLSLEIDGVKLNVQRGAAPARQPGPAELAPQPPALSRNRLSQQCERPHRRLSQA